MSTVASDGAPSLVAGMAVRCFGPAGAPAILLSAGLGGTGAYWMPQVEALARRYRVILYDHRGTGDSERFAPGPDYAVDDLARDMLALLDGLGIGAAAVIGHAAGAVAGLELARFAPARVAALVIVNGWAVSSAHFRRCMALRRAIYAAGGVDAYLTAQPLFLYPADWIDQHLDRLDSERATHLDRFQDAATLYARMAALERFDARPWLPQVSCPVLVMVAKDDMLVPPSCSEVLAATIPHARLSSFERGGHAVNITCSEAFDSALGMFLDPIILPKES